MPDEYLLDDLFERAIDENGVLGDVLIDRGNDSVRLSSEPDRAATEFAEPAVDAIIDRAAIAGMTISEEVRAAVLEAVKKKYPPRS